VKLFRRFGQFVTDQIRQGLTPHEMALTLGVGLCLSVPPMLGTTTLLCALAAIVLRLNQPLIQTVNVLAYPLQLALLVPFLRAGEWLFGTPHTPLSPAKILAMGKADLVGTIGSLWTVTWHGAVVWVIASVPAGLLVYLSAKPALERVAARLRNQDVSRVA
jgi:uncharacterized protein (DUF2062 family)